MSNTVITVVKSVLLYAPPSIPHLIGGNLPEPVGVPNGTGKENEIPLKQGFHRFAVKHPETSFTCMAENEPTFRSALKAAVLFEGVFPIQ